MMLTSDSRFSNRSLKVEMVGHGFEKQKSIFRHERPKKIDNLYGIPEHYPWAKYARIPCVDTKGPGLREKRANQTQNLFQAKYPLSPANSMTILYVVVMSFSREDRCSTLLCQSL